MFVPQPPGLTLALGSILVLLIAIFESGVTPVGFGLLLVGGLGTTVGLSKYWGTGGASE